MTVKNAESIPGVSRRTFIRGIGATAAAGVGIKYAGSPIGRSEALVPAIGVAVGLSYLAYRYGTEAGGGREELGRLILGDSRDMSGYADADILHQELIQGALEMQSADERVMTSIENNLTNSENVALAKGKAAAIEAMNNEKSESEAQTAMQAAIDGYYATIQANIIIHFREQYAQVAHQATQVQEHPDLSVLHQVGFERSGSTHWSTTDQDHNIAQTTQDTEAADPGATIEETSVDLLDGSSINYIVSYRTYQDYDNYLAVSQDHVAGTKPARVRFPKFDSSEYVVYLDSRKYEAAWDEIIITRDQVNADLSGFIADVYAQWSPGEIPTEDLIDPITAATELGQDYGYQRMASAQAAMLGIPTTETRSLVLEIHTDGDTSTDGTRVNADMYTDHTPDSGEYQVGDTYDPSTWSSPLYIAYTTEDGSSNFSEIENPFTIVSATNLDGNPVESFGTKNTNNQTADVSKLREEIEQLNELIAEEREKEESSGGGGGASTGSQPEFVAWFSEESLINGIPNIVPTVGGLAAVYAWLGGGS